MCKVSCPLSQEQIYSEARAKDKEYRDILDNKIREKKLQIELTNKNYKQSNNLHFAHLQYCKDIDSNNYGWTLRYLENGSISFEIIKLNLCKCNLHKCTCSILKIVNSLKEFNNVCLIGKSGKIKIYRGYDGCENITVCKITVKDGKIINAESF